MHTNGQAGVQATDHHARKGYRPDIDGLRALAVLSVVFYHLFPQRLRGGFVGVDVFFVISGFLISRIILDELGNGTFRFGDFYARRVRRIFPALFLVLLFTLVFGWFALLPDEYEQLGEHVAAGAYFMQNITLWREVGYFDNEADSKPLLHLWSLGVEEQFYLVWPLLLWCAWRVRRFATHGLVILSCASLAFSLLATVRAPEAAFYWLPSRFWELACGSLLAWWAVVLARSDVGESHDASPKAPSRSRFFRFRAHCMDAISVLGLAGLALAFFTVSSGYGFPGVKAILPVAAAVLIIAAGPGALVNRTLLSHPVLVWFGLLSFPLYLWHWPLLVYVRILDGEELRFGTAAVVFLVSVLLAWITYRGVEARLRHGPHPAMKAVFLAAGVGLLGLVGLEVSRQDGLVDRSVLLPLKEQARDLEFSIPRSRGWVCDRPDMRNVSCHVTGGRPDVVVLGDSHAARLYSGLSEHYAKVGRSVALLGGRGGCPPLVGIVSKNNAGQDTRECPERAGVPLKTAMADSMVRDVILINRGVMYTGERRSSRDWVLHLEGESPDLRSNREAYSVAFERTLQSLLATGKRITFVHTSPDLGVNVRKCAQARPLVPFWASTPVCGVERRRVVEQESTYRALVAGVLSRYPQVQTVDLADALCDASHCYGTKDGVLLYTDSNHLSHRGSRLAIEKLASQFPG